MPVALRPRRTPPTPPTRGAAAARGARKRGALVGLLVAVAVGGGVGYAARGSDIRPLQITSNSMSPAIERGEWIVVRDLAGAPEARIRRGDIVLFRFPLGTSGRAVKRVVALGGDRVTIAERSVTVAGRVIPIAGAPSASARRERSETVAPGHVFLLGDNAAASIDSRSFRPVPASEIVARQVLVIGSLRRLLVAVFAVLALLACGLLLVARHRRRALEPGAAQRGRSDPPRLPPRRPLK